MGCEVPAILDAMEGVENIHFHRVSQIAMPHWTKGRVALLGDAAACVSLLAGQGCGLAMAEAYVLAGEIARAGNDHYAVSPSPPRFARHQCPEPEIHLVLRDTPHGFRIRSGH